MKNIKSRVFIIGEAPITQVTHVRNKDSNIQGRLLNVLCVIFPYYKELLLKERICSIWEQSLSFKRSSHFWKGAQLKKIIAWSSESPFDVRNFFSVLATPLHMILSWVAIAVNEHEKYHYIALADSFVFQKTIDNNVHVWKIEQGNLLGRSKCYC